MATDTSSGSDSRSTADGVSGGGIVGSAVSCCHGRDLPLVDAVKVLAELSLAVRAAVGSQAQFNGVRG